MIVTHVRFKSQVRVRTSLKGSGDDMSGIQHPSDQPPKFDIEFDASAGLLVVRHIASGSYTFVPREDVLWFYADPPAEVAEELAPTAPASPRGRRGGHSSES